MWHSEMNVSVLFTQFNRNGNVLTAVMCQCCLHSVIGMAMC